MYSIYFPRQIEFIEALSRSQGILAKAEIVVRRSDSGATMILYITGIRNMNHVSFQIHRDYTSVKLFTLGIKELLISRGVTFCQ